MNGSVAQSRTADLLTIGDWLRYAVSSFNQAGLVYGHGTTNAFDEAAYLILSALHLPIDALDPWLPCRLTAAERQCIDDLVLQRLTTRKPAAYLLNRAWIGPFKFYVDERVIVPRSFIGELLIADALNAIIADPDQPLRILDLCTGSGCLAILAAITFPNATVDAADVSADALSVARRNLDDYELAARITLHQGHLFEPLADARFDLIICNPPYVTAGAVDAFPPEYRAEPELAHLGGADGLTLVRAILDAAPAHLHTGGTLVMEVGEQRDALEAQRPDLPFLWLDTEDSTAEVFTLSSNDWQSAKNRRSTKAGRPRNPSDG